MGRLSATARRKMNQAVSTSTRYPSYCVTCDLICSSQALPDASCRTLTLLKTGHISDPPWNNDDRQVRGNSYSISLGLPCRRCQNRKTANTSSICSTGFGLAHYLLQRNNRTAPSSRRQRDVPTTIPGRIYRAFVNWASANPIRFLRLVLAAVALIYSAAIAAWSLGWLGG